MGAHKDTSIETRRRNIEMAVMFSKGIPMQSVGTTFGVSRERVRQILKEMNYSTADGGNRKRLDDQNSLVVKKREAKSLAKYGCSVEQLKFLKSLSSTKSGEYGTSPIGAYAQQKKAAKKRGVAWEFTLWGWWEAWRDSGKWDQRGKKGGYVMCRIRDEGPYAPGNVYFATAIENTNDYYIVHKSSHRPKIIRGMIRAITKRGICIEEVQEIVLKMVAEAGRPVANLAEAA